MKSGKNYERPLVKREEIDLGEKRFCLATAFCGPADSHDRSGRGTPNKNFQPILKQFQKSSTKAAVWL